MPDWESPAHDHTPPHAESLRATVTALAARLGRDPLLVQGAGGNVSWKEAGTLWVKASGTWLAEANHQDIFVPVDLRPLRESLDLGDYGVTPRVLGESTLRPSIETLLHGLMPQRVVVHVHGVEILAHLVRPHWETRIPERMTGPLGKIPWSAVPYRKPGASLAEAVALAPVHPGGAGEPARVVFLGNHGVVVGGDSAQQVEALLADLTRAFHSPGSQPLPRRAGAPAAPVPAELARDYQPLPAEAPHQLALAPDYLARLETDWALYPDHVVFLDPAAAVFSGWSALAARVRDLSPDALPELVFVAGEGIYSRAALGQAKIAQLCCYHEVLLRQAPDQPLAPLCPTDVAQLLDWDAEKYRQHIAR